MINDCWVLRILPVLRQVLQILWSSPRLQSCCVLDPSSCCLDLGCITRPWLKCDSEYPIVGEDLRLLRYPSCWTTRHKLEQGQHTKKDSAAVRVRRVDQCWNAINTRRGRGTKCVLNARCHQYGSALYRAFRPSSYGTR